MGVFIGILINFIVSNFGGFGNEVLGGSLLINIVIFILMLIGSTTAGFLTAKMSKRKYLLKIIIMVIISFFLILKSYSIGISFGLYTISWVERAFLFTMPLMGLIGLGLYKWQTKINVNANSNLNSQI